MQLRIISWNVRGLNAADKRAVVKSVLVGARPHIVCLQETKIERMDLFLVREVWGGRFVEWEFLPSRGASGGILVCWDNQVVIREEMERGGFSVSCLFNCVADEFRWVFTRVYGPVLGFERGDFYEELENVAFRWQRPWCVCGDFNAVRFPFERTGSHRLSDAMVGSVDVLMSCSWLICRCKGAVHMVQWADCVSARPFSCF